MAYFSIVRALSGAALFAALAFAQNSAAQIASPSNLYAVALPDDSAPPALPREFRGVWVASVGNMDWPSRAGLSADQQQAELLAILDRAVQLHLNAVILQVRPAADALYQSKIEPWSAVLTGTMGRSPGYDPLAFAVAEAHKRGLELHAWFNPYRARFRNTKGKTAPGHVSRAMPSVVKPYGPYLWMDPGEPSVRAQATKVILDVVRRYDVDGIHLDDYFYPYPERNRRGQVIPFPDDRSWKRYVKGGGTLDRDDWRRQNVDLLIEGLYREVKKAKPWVRFGISPFGIWRPGYPPSVNGFDQYGELYADARKWLMQGWLDYITPQLYWRVGAPQQSYAALLRWWAQQNVHGRHLWPGNADYKVANSGEQWSASEIVDQIRVTRDQPGAEGNVHFNESALTANVDNLMGRLGAGPYASLALPPASPWLTRGAPAPPTVSRRDAGGVAVLRLTPAAPAATLRWWLVRARYPDGWHALVADASERTLRLGANGAGELPDFIAVNAVDVTGTESAEVDVLSERGTKDGGR
jgi:uncharacterized lipoprotein YddW (UPF0748 family)